MLLLVCGDIESCPGPVLFRNASDLTILHQNVCGLASKKDILEDFILEKNVKIFIVTETHLQSATPTSLVDIWGYTFERNGHKSKWGGAGIYIKENIEYIRRNDLNDENVEAVWIEILQITRKVSYLVYYIDPQLPRNI